MASRNKDERKLVGELVKNLLKNSPDMYVYIDRDAGNVRHTSSGFDFILVYEGQAVFCEAKQSKGKLSSWQQFIQAQIIASRTKYSVVRFADDGKSFQIDNGKMIDIETAKFEDFL